MDIIDLHQFYGSPLGTIATKAIGDRLSTLWPDVVGDRVLGFGYAAPFLPLFQARAERTLSLMPASIGAMPFLAADGRGLGVLCEDTLFPIPDQSIDRLLVIHGLENAPDSKVLLRECWRILCDGGRLIVIVPNRRGFWARAPKTPFGCGQPYSGHQLFDLIAGSLFTPTKPTYALYTPPLEIPGCYRLSSAIEHIGSKHCKKFGGVVMIEAKKQILARILEKPAPWRKRIFIPKLTKTAPGCHRDDEP